MQVLRLIWCALSVASQKGTAEGPLQAMEDICKCNA